MKSQIDRLKELSNRCSLKEFDAPKLLTPQQNAAAKGQLPEGNVTRAVATTIISHGGLNGIQALPSTIMNAIDAEKENQVYRKRDALADAWRQTGSATVGGMAGVLAAARMGAKPKHITIGALAGSLAGAGAGYLWARKAGANRIEKNKQMSSLDKLKELSRKEFDAPKLLTPQQNAAAKGQLPNGNVTRAVGTSLLIGGGISALPATIANARNAEAADQVYRKRDAFTDGFRQQGGILAGAALGAGGSLAAHEIKERVTSARHPGEFAQRAGRVNISHKLNAKARTIMTDAERSIHTGLGAVAGSLAGAGAGYLWARKAGANRIEKNKQMSSLDKLKELSRKIELGYLGMTETVPQYDGANGQFSGTDQEVDPMGVAKVGVGAAAAGALGYAGYKGHQSVMANYGNLVDANPTAGAYSRLGSNIASGFQKNSTAAASTLGGFLDRGADSIRDKLIKAGAGIASKL